MAPTMEAAPITRQQFQTKLAERSLKNPEFRAAFIADPKGALEKEFETKFAESVKIYAHEEDVNTLHLAIPAMPENLEELSDEDLEKVAGGMTPLFAVAFLGGAGCCAFGIWVGRNF
jgi:hypothetical protein